MAIVESKVYRVRVQRDGWQWVTEHHVDHTGKIHPRRGYYDPDYDPASGLNAHARELDEQLVTGELWYGLGKVRDKRWHPDDVPLKHNSRGALYRFCVKRLANADAKEALRWLPLVDQFSDAQIAGLLGVAESVITDWRARLHELANAQAILDAYVAPVGPYPEVMGDG